MGTFFLVFIIFLLKYLELSNNYITFASTLWIIILNSATL